jgi:hypothetical protein
MFSLEELQTYKARTDFENPEKAKQIREEEGQRLWQKDEIYNNFGMLIASGICIMIVIGIISSL